MKHITTVTQGDWSVGGMSPPMVGGIGTELWVSRRVRGKDLHPGCHKRVFPTQEAANAYTLEHGFTQVYYHRPNGFIDLRLSPATRRYLRSKKRTEVWTLLSKILPCPQTYFRDVRNKEYMQATRDRWIDAIYTRGGRNHPGRKLSVGIRTATKGSMKTKTKNGEQYVQLMTEAEVEKFAVDGDWKNTADFLRDVGLHSVNDIIGVWFTVAGGRLYFA